MPEFEDSREQLRAARAAREAGAEATRAARERVRRLAKHEAALDRVLGPRDRAHSAERERLHEERKAAEAEQSRARDAQRRFAAAEAEALATFARFSDPRKGIGKLDDATPILLMPVRLETRFKTVTRDGARVPQLWVRIYPDDCWIDAFDPTLTETEVENAKRYWVAFVEASGDEALERAAWQALVTSHGSGRAAWILEAFAPASLDVLPEALVFPEFATKQSAWAQAPKCTLLPERFVFIGYEGGGAPRVEIGGAVQLPLHTAPDPSAPQDEQLQHDDDGHLIMPEELKWIADSSARSRWAWRCASISRRRRPRTASAGCS